jgi:hypothetical protein
MTLALKPPLAAMEALSVDEIPQGPEWQYEPKRDRANLMRLLEGR